MILILMAVLGFACAILPAALFLRNLPLFSISSGNPKPNSSGNLEANPVAPLSVSVLIPARDEAAGIEAAVTAALASTGVDVEVVVLDDQSSDDTAAIVEAISRGDPRVRLAAGIPLPDGWNGKQHACYRLSELARHDLFVFLDADVRLQKCALQRLVNRYRGTGVALLSAFPHQETGTWLEKWIIPMMHYVLLGYLPMDRMRASTDPSFAAGCGQLFLTSRESYRRAGTHRAIAASRHDGLKLPRAYRRADLSTDVIDGTALASCRMYRSAAEVVRGVLKNAVEGIANPRLIVPFSLLLIGGSVLPLILLIVACGRDAWWSAGVSAVAMVLGHLPRAIAATTFRQSFWGVVFHAPAVAVFVGLQWVALTSHLLGRRVAWRGRN